MRHRSTGAPENDRPGGSRLITGIALYSSELAVLVKAKVFFVAVPAHPHMTTKTMAISRPDMMLRQRAIILAPSLEPASVSRQSYEAHQLATFFRPVTISK